MLSIEEINKLQKENEQLQNDLSRKTQECEKWKNQVLILDDENVTIQVTQEQFEEYQQLKQGCEKLKEKLRELELKNTTLQNRNQQLDGSMTEADSYRKALEEIEKVCLEDTYTFADGTQIRYDSLDDILDIINKAKGNN